MSYHGSGNAKAGLGQRRQRRHGIYAKSGTVSTRVEVGSHGRNVDSNRRLDVMAVAPCRFQRVFNRLLGPAITR